MYLNIDSLSIMLITTQTSVMITQCIQPTSIITMAMKVFHNTCNICIRDLLDKHAEVQMLLTIRIQHTYLKPQYTYQIKPMPMLQPLRDVISNAYELV